MIEKNTKTIDPTLTPAAPKQPTARKPYTRKPKSSTKPADTTLAMPAPKQPTVRKPYTRKQKPALPTSLQTIANAAKTPEYTPANLKNLMERLDMNEKAFAFVMNVSPMTVRLWLAGAVKPCNSAVRLMQIMAGCPELAADVLAGRRYADGR